MLYEYISSILIIMGIDIILGGDNAVVIALASRNLPQRQRNAAIVLGTALAIVIRIILTAAVVILLKIPFLQLVGGGILLWISIKLLAQKAENTALVKPETTIWKAVQTIVTADIVMGLDNVVAIAGAAQGNIYLVIFGFLVSVPIIILGSRIILHLIERFPILIYVGAAILAYTAGQMITNENQIQYIYEEHAFFKTALPFITVILVILAGTVINRRTLHD